MKTIKEPRTSARRGRSLAREHFKAFIDTISDLIERKEIAPDIGRHLLLFAWTGCRRGEGLALKWTDYAHGELTISRSVYKRSEKSTKTDDPRTVAVVKPLADVLEEQRRWLLETQHPGLESSLMFPASPEHARLSATKRGVDEISWYRSPSALDRPLAKVVAGADVPEISLQSFRRTFENLLRRADVDQLVRRAMAGWRTEDAQEIYAGVDREERAAAGATIVELVMEGGGRR